MDVLPSAIVGARLMVDAIRQVLADPSFKTTSSEASEAQHAAERLSVWVENESNYGTFERFSTAVYEDLSGLFTDGTVHSRLAYSFCQQREDVAKPFFLRSSEIFIMRWKKFLEAAEASTIPIFFQHVTDVIFKSMIHTCYKNPSEAAVTAPISPTEANALRYAAGYIC